ncbi:hypothetical protein SprV_0301277100 [Sparganum proliferum]
MQAVPSLNRAALMCRRGRTPLWASNFVVVGERLEFANGLRHRREPAVSYGAPDGRISVMPIRRSVPPADQRHTRRSLVTTVPTRCFIRPTVQRSPHYPVHGAQRVPGVPALTCFSLPVETVARGVAAELSPATWSHR